MSSYFEFARHLLLGETLDHKFYQTPVEWDVWRPFALPERPGRQGSLVFSKQQAKFPKYRYLNQPDKKALALHSFANHELLAIEMMAAALLIYPHHSSEDMRFKNGVLAALKDEQKHLGLYIGRLNELGYEFGDFPLNDFFWRQMPKLETKAQYLAVMSLTFEAANLDFAQFYANIFRGFGDERTAAILDIVLEDEISHVAFGGFWLKKWRENKVLWDYYMENLPWPITPERSKGIGFDPELRRRPLADDDFIQALVNFQSDFRITRRSP